MSSNVPAMKYLKGYKYQLYEDFLIQLGFDVPTEVDTQFIALSVTGLLQIKRGYAWDGLSGGALDTTSGMTASLVHDALYQCVRMKLVPAKFRRQIDDEFYRICIEKGMWTVRAWWMYRAVRRLGEPFATMAPKDPIVAP